jgi:hypothetical protein
MQFDGVKVFSATKARDRDDLGSRITDWISNNKTKIEIVDKKVTQSSDNEYHCFTVTIFYKFT